MLKASDIKLSPGAAQHCDCESCALGKSHERNVRKKATYRASRILELVHIDLQQFPTRSKGGG